MLDNELPPHPEKRPVYSSTAIMDRRARILEETRRMLGESGMDGLSIRELCKRANIALRTLYNTFYSKDRLVAIAIRDAYDQVNRNIRYRTPSDTLDGVIDRMILTYRSSMAARNFTRSISSLYFVPGLSPDIWTALQNMVFRNLNPWLHKVERDGELQAGVHVDELAGIIANMEYSTSHDWSEGRISDPDFIHRLVTGMLRISAGSMLGGAQQRALHFLSLIHDGGTLPVFPNPGWRDNREEKSDS
ncbi:MAG: TetR/AcrR family transcriptional regulator [Novosphingobium sp.]|nr:TetR/AcrR family transcriptional regulator [Novosphingobium sp.]